jgi:TolB-like protein/Flp pilus assembly protein TadD
MLSEGTLPTQSTVIPAPGLRLDSWKEIATHLNHSSRTVRRWEQEEGLPVHRHLHRKKGTVYAFSIEVDAWLRGRGVAAGEVLEPGPSASGHSPGPARESGQKAPPGRPIVIAVLPLRNLSGDPAQERFSDALTDEIILELGQFSPGRLRVVPFGSVAQYKQPAKNIGQIGHELGADYLLEGGVRRYGLRLRVTARVTSARDQVRVLAESYEIELPPFFSLQQGLARQLVGALSAKLRVIPTGGPHRQTGCITPGHDAYLAGTLHLGWSEAQIEKSIEHFSLAVERDPDCAAGYAELALAYHRLGLMYDYPPIAAFGWTKELALKALSLDPGLSCTHVALATYNLYGAWNWSEAEASSRRAIELDPGNSRGYAIRSACYLVMGRPDEAVKDLEQAHRLDPHSPTVGMALAIVGLYARRYDIASQCCQEILRRDPSSTLAHLLLGTYYARKGENARALTHCLKARGISSGRMLPAATLCSVYAMAGQQDSAERLLDELVAMEKQQYVRYIFLAQASASLRKDKETLEWLERAYQQRDPLLVFLNSDRRFEPLSRSARFRDLLSRIGLPS